jgi:hypothetical protein
LGLDLSSVCHEPSRRNKRYKPDSGIHIRIKKPTNVNHLSGINTGWRIIKSQVNHTNALFFGYILLVEYFFITHFAKDLIQSPRLNFYTFSKKHFA